MTNQKNPFLLITTLLIGLVIGFISGNTIKGGPLNTLDQSAQIQKLQSQIEQAKKFFPSTPPDIRNISGTIKEVKGNIITVETVRSNPFDGTPVIRHITIDKDTKMIKNEQRDPAVYKREADEFYKTLRASAPLPRAPATVPAAPPSPYREVPIHLSDLKPSQRIIIRSAENIRDKESFSATEVSIFAVPTVSNMAPPSVKPPVQVK